MLAHTLSLAIFHHILVFGLVAMLFMQRTLLSVSPINIRRIARLDMGVGITALLVLIVGIGRVMGPGKGWAFYQDNPFFWIKIACFALIGLLSIAPTVAILKWSKAVKADPTFQPQPMQVRQLRMITGLMALLLIPLLASAAAMARYPF